ncbi:MAG: branched-chain amino acid ABC transporter permease [Candidatus Tectimicrobiota bacterium]|nr:MAG: branched-chain amino acid ABC transporter permease [Candidatus Tectomicrobia bacterium]
MSTTGSWLRYATLPSVGLVLACLPLAILGSALYARLATQMLAYIAYTVAFNLIFGHTRQLFLCLGALAGASAYFSVILTRELGLSPWLTVLLGTALAAALGTLFSYISVRRGLGVIFLGIVTLAFSLMFENLLLGLRDLTRGETGIVTKGLGFGILGERWASYYVFLGLLLLALALYQALVSSKIGLALRALSDDELAAELAGINVVRYKVLAAGVGSALLGVVGACYAYYNGYVNPSIFSLVGVDVVVLVMLLFGGMGTLLGPVLGGAVFTVVNELVRPLGPLNLLVYGALLIVLFLAFREGLVVALRRATGLPLP